MHIMEGFLPHPWWEIWLIISLPVVAWGVPHDQPAEADFVEDPVGVPMLAAWVRVNAAIPDFEDRVCEAVELDNA